MLSLHHLEGGTFTLIRHQLSRCYTSPLFPQLTLVSRERVARPNSVILDIGAVAQAGDHEQGQAALKHLQTEVPDLQPLIANTLKRLQGVAE